MKSRTVLIVLFVSLACNLFLVGAVVGGLVVGARFKAAPAEARQPLWRAADALPQAHRHAYREALRAQTAPVAGALREARRARREAWQGLAREPFDEARVVADLDRARAREMEARAAVERRIVTFAGTLSARERAELAAGLERAGPRRRPDGPPRRPPSPETPPK